MEGDIEVLEKAIQNLEAIGEKDDDLSHQDLYKNWGKYGSQEERRKELLETQKSNRQNKVDKLRGLINVVKQEKTFKPSNKVSYRPNIYVAGFHKTPQTYSNVLMLSEWLIEKPSDFETNWYIAPCPKAMRLLVIAFHGNTKCFTKYGHFKFECCTSLPGGNPKSSGNCVLDCFYDKESNTMYVLDLLAWNNQPMTDGETEFRQFWMQTHLNDISAIKKISNFNKVIFKLLPMIPCTKENLNNLFSKFPPCDDLDFPALDGLLFYHRQAHYFAGQTPLVGWLFPYMVNEVLGQDITVSSEYLAGTPEDYTNQTDFISRFEEKLKQRSRRSINNSSMETENVESEENTESDKKVDSMESEVTRIDPRNK
ncbi:unnamed protein product [Pieris macdunnoughi]|uniref:Snurportin-1 n=1 Tax=Pieris macdunnoughi TaxID=345717 RepID=A0A821NU10_9NEOP|nr:unnamed protein product [Pieris macdunnoughi]